MGDKFYTNIDGRPTLKELTAAGVSLLDSGGYYSSNNLEDLAIELYGRSNKNYCINGNFDIWQRGTSFTNPALYAYTADRNQVILALDGGTPPTIVHSRQTLTPGELDKSNYFYRINANGAGSGYGNSSYYTLYLQQIENGTRLLCGLNKKITISFYARSSVNGRVIVLEPIQNYGGGGIVSSEELLTPLRIILTTSWTKYTHTFTTNTLVGKTFGGNYDDRLKFWIWLQGGSTHNSRITSPIPWASGNVDIAQIQINAGDTALDYVAPIPSEEYRKCQRYYYIAPSEQRLSWTLDINTIISFIAIPTMRIAPTLSVAAPPTSGNTFLSYNPSAWYTFTSYTGVNYMYSGINMARVEFTFSGGGGCTANAFGTMLRTCNFDAEF